MLLGKKFLITGRVSGCMNGTQPTDTVQRPYELAQFNSLLQSVGVQKIVAAYTTCYLLTDEGDVYAHRPSVCQCCRYSWGSSVWGELGIKNRNQTQNENSISLSILWIPLVLLYSSSPIKVNLSSILLPSEHVIDIQSKMNHVVCLTNEGGIIGWGANKNNCLNTPTNERAIFNAPELLCPRHDDIKSIYVSNKLTMYRAVSSDNTNLYGQNYQFENPYSSKQEYFAVYYKDHLQKEKWKNELMSYYNHNLFARNPSSPLYKWVQNNIADGIPHCYRSTLYCDMVGNHLHINRTIYNTLVEFLKSHRNILYSRTIYPSIDISYIQPLFTSSENDLQSIEKDLPRTFSNFNFFSKESPNCLRLRQLLELFCCYRYDIGYHQVMSFIGGLLCLVIEDDYELFVCFTNLMTSYHYYAFNRQLDTYQLYVLSVVFIEKYSQYIELLKSVLNASLPLLSKHMDEQMVEYNVFFPWWLHKGFISILSYRVFALFMESWNHGVGRSSNMGQLFVWRLILPL